MKNLLSRYLSLTLSLCLVGESCPALALRQEGRLPLLSSRPSVYAIQALNPRATDFPAELAGSARWKAFRQQSAARRPRIVEAAPVTARLILRLMGMRRPGQIALRRVLAFLEPPLIWFSPKSTYLAWERVRSAERDVIRAKSIDRIRAIGLIGGVLGFALTAGLHTGDFSWMYSVTATLAGAYFPSSLYLLWHQETHGWAPLSLAQEPLPENPRWPMGAPSFWRSVDRLRSLETDYSNYTPIKDDHLSMSRFNQLSRSLFLRVLSASDRKEAERLAQLLRTKNGYLDGVLQAVESVDSLTADQVKFITHEFPLDFGFGRSTASRLFVEMAKKLDEPGPEFIDYLFWLMDPESSAPSDLKAAFQAVLERMIREPLNAELLDRFKKLQTTYFPTEKKYVGHQFWEAVLATFPADREFSPVVKDALAEVLKAVSISDLSSYQLNNQRDPHPFVVSALQTALDQTLQNQDHFSPSNADVMNYVLAHTVEITPDQATLYLESSAFDRGYGTDYARAQLIESILAKSTSITPAMLQSLERSRRYTSVEIRALATRAIGTHPDFAAMAIRDLLADERTSVVDKVRRLHAIFLETTSLDPAARLAGERYLIENTSHLATDGEVQWRQWRSAPEDPQILERLRAMMGDAFFNDHAVLRTYLQRALASSSSVPDFRAAFLRMVAADYQLGKTRRETDWRSPQERAPDALEAFQLMLAMGMFIASASMPDWTPRDMAAQLRSVYTWCSYQSASLRETIPSLQCFASHSPRLESMDRLIEVMLRTDHNADRYRVPVLVGFEAGLAPALTRVNATLATATAEISTVLERSYAAMLNLRLTEISRMLADDRLKTPMEKLPAEYLLSLAQQRLALVGPSKEREVASVFNWLTVYLQSPVPFKEQELLPLMRQLWMIHLRMPKDVSGEYALRALATALNRPDLTESSAIAELKHEILAHMGTLQTPEDIKAGLEPMLLRPPWNRIQPHFAQFIFQAASAVSGGLAAVPARVMADLYVTTAASGISNAQSLLPVLAMDIQAVASPTELDMLIRGMAFDGFRIMEHRETALAVYERLQDDSPDHEIENALVTYSAPGLTAFLTQAGSAVNRRELEYIHKVFTDILNRPPTDEEVVYLSYVLETVFKAQGANWEKEFRNAVTNYAAMRTHLDAVNAEIATAELKLAADSLPKLLMEHRILPSTAVSSRAFSLKSLRKVRQSLSLEEYAKLLSGDPGTFEFLGNNGDLDHPKLCELAAERKIFSPEILQTLHDGVALFRDAPNRYKIMFFFIGRRRDKATYEDKGHRPLFERNGLLYDFYLNLKTEHDRKAFRDQVLMQVGSDYAVNGSYLTSQGRLATLARNLLVLEREHGRHWVNVLSQEDFGRFTGIAQQVEDTQKNLFASLAEYNTLRCLTSWGNFEGLSKLLVVLADEPLWTALSTLAQSGPEGQRKATYYTRIFAHPNMHDAEALLQLMNAPEQFFSRAASYTAKAFRQYFLLSNLQHIEHMDLTVAELRDALINGQLDSLQVFKPFSMEFIPPVEKSLTGLALLQALFNPGVADRRQLQASLVRFIDARLEQNRAPQIQGALTILRSWAASDQFLEDAIPDKVSRILSSARFNLRDLEAAGLKRTVYTLRIWPKSKPEASLVGNDSVRCNVFEDGKSTDEVYDPTTGIFTISRMETDRFGNPTETSLVNSVLHADYHVPFDYGAMVHQLKLASEEERRKFSYHALMGDQFVDEASAEVYLTLDNLDGSLGNRKIDMEWFENAVVHPGLKAFFSAYLAMHPRTPAGRPFHADRLMVGLNTGVYLKKLFQTQKVANQFMPVSPLTYTDNSTSETGYIVLNEAAKKPASTQGTVVRKLTPEDAMAAAYIESAAFANASGRAHPGKVRNEILAATINEQIKPAQGLERPNFSYGYFVDGRLVGYILAYAGYEGTAEGRRDVIYVEDYAVLPKYRGFDTLQILRTLFSAMQEYAATRHAKGWDTNVIFESTTDPNGSYRLFGLTEEQRNTMTPESQKKLQDKKFQKFRDMGVEIVDLPNPTSALVPIRMKIHPASRIRAALGAVSLFKQLNAAQGLHDRLTKISS